MRRGWRRDHWRRCESRIVRCDGPSGLERRRSHETRSRLEVRSPRLRCSVRKPSRGSMGWAEEPRWKGLRLEARADDARLQRGLWISTGLGGGRESAGRSDTKLATRTSGAGRNFGSGRRTRDESRVGGRAVRGSPSELDAPHGVFGSRGCRRRAKGAEGRRIGTPLGPDPPTIDAFGWRLRRVMASRAERFAQRSFFASS